MATCVHCSRDIVQDADGRWVDPAATGDDSVWRETCDSHDTFVADHEPVSHTFAPGMSDDSDPDQTCIICGLTEPEHTPCAACNAEPGEECRPGCIGKAAHDEGDI